MTFRETLKRLYNEKLCGFGDKASFDFNGIFGISDRSFRAMFDGRNLPIRHDVAEQVLAQWVAPEEHDAMRALPDYPQKPRYVQQDIDELL